MRTRIMGDIRSTSSLRADGVDAKVLRKAVSAGEVDRLRRGVYRAPGELSHTEQHRLMVLGTMPGLCDEAVVSHASAGVLHGLLVRTASLGRVHVTRQAKGWRTALVHVHTAALPDDEVCLVQGLRTTTIRRTLSDLGRCEDLGWAVVALDDALRRNLVECKDLDALTLAAKGLPGAPGLRAAVQLADGESQSAGESLCRVAFHQAGLPIPVLQYEVRDAKGLVGRVDLCWPEQKVIVEFDGKVKYGALLRPGERPSDALWREKQREDRLRACGYRVIRVTWDEILREPEEVCRRVASALWK
ncbi:hypothetical protein GCM10027030_25150 [Luteococcus sediminum]